MGDETDYEILPHEELEHLRNEVSQIKKNPLGKRYGGSDLIDSVHKLTETLNNMNHIFTSTNQELLDDFKEHSMQKSFETMTEQNEELAKGILSVAQLVQKQSDVITSFIDKLDKMFKRQEEQDKLEMEKIQKIDLPEPKPKQSQDSNQPPKMDPTTDSKNKPSLPPIPKDTSSGNQQQGSNKNQQAPPYNLSPMPGQKSPKEDNLNLEPLNLQDKK